ncbi:hypothetical protein Bca52824_044320 [Brassica carinata]|uniref:Uncharacterized protein n=1 Tax=Brassica carinata TaxID=52824 RepID=A0A8X7V2W6_BRACI|nr:hypothetical protein Bca52824_044320 [Brassica carinata]
MAGRIEGDCTGVGGSVSFFLFCLLHRLLSSPVRSALAWFCPRASGPSSLAIDPAARSVKRGESGVAAIGVRTVGWGRIRGWSAPFVSSAGALTVDLTWYHGEKRLDGVDLLSRLFKSLEIPRFVPYGGFRSRFLGRPFPLCFGRSYSGFQMWSACEEPLFWSCRPSLVGLRGVREESRGDIRVSLLVSSWEEGSWLWQLVSLSLHNKASSVEGNASLEVLVR